jgi:hypothetical protein
MYQQRKELSLAILEEIGFQKIEDSNLNDKLR